MEHKLIKIHLPLEHEQKRKCLIDIENQIGVIEKVEDNIAHTLPYVYEKTN